MRVWLVTLASLLIGCGGSEGVAASGDAGIDARVDPPDTAVGIDARPPLDAGPIVKCKLEDGSDPVGLCVQKLVLARQHEAAFLVGVGIASRWEPKTYAIDKDASGNPVHGVRDDVSYGASIARYWVRARAYGDNEITSTLVKDLVALAPLVEKQLATLPDAYDGELYLDLRQMAAGLRLVNENDKGNALDAIADKYGRAIHAHFRKLKSDAGVLGAMVGTDVVYEPAQVASGALALIDLATRAAPTDATLAKEWQTSARLSLDHLQARARDAKTALHFRALRVSADPARDALEGSSDPDALLVDVQATIALSLVRAQALVSKNAEKLAVVADYPFETRAIALLDAMHEPSLALWDETKKGYFEGFLPASKATIPRKATRANTRMLSAIHRAFLGKGTTWVKHEGALRTLLLKQLPYGTSLLSVVPDQDGYLRAATSDFLLPEGGRYAAEANADAIEALDEQWLGRPG